MYHLFIVKVKPNENDWATRVLQRYSPQMFWSPSYTCKVTRSLTDFKSLRFFWVSFTKRRWVILSSQEPTEVQISKLKSTLSRQNQICILVIAFLPAQLNRTLMKKIINIKCTQKCTKYQEIWLFKANFCTEWVKWIKPFKTYLCSKCFAWKIIETRPTLC